MLQPGDQYGFTADKPVAADMRSSVVINSSHNKAMGGLSMHPPRHTKLYSDAQ